MDEMYAYARGYYDGRENGVENCPFEAENLRLHYKQGYEAGVHDYCREAHPEDEEQ
jgi:ribosome modulation factor